jgi:dipeptidyl-peptidase-4
MPFWRWGAGFLTVGALVGSAGVAAAQRRGVPLFEAMLEQRIGQLAGQTSVTWLPNGLGYLDRRVDSTGEQVGFFRVDPSTGKQTPLFTPSVEAKLVRAFAQLTGSPATAVPLTAVQYVQGGKAVLLTVRGGGARYLFTLATGELRRLMVPANVGPVDEMTTEPGTFSPDYNYYAFIRDYDNLFLCDTRTGAEKRLTTGTSENNLIGFLGAGPWYVWSPDSRHIAYFKADQGTLYRYPILHDLEQKATLEYLRYPFTSDPNPPIDLYVVDIENARSVKIASGTTEEPYLRDIAWFDDGTEVTFQVVNQWENRLTLKAATPTSGQVRAVLVDEDAAFLDPLHNFLQLKDGTFTWSSERSGWRQIYRYDRQGRQLYQLTQGEWDTGEITGIDEAGQWVYFEAATHLGLDRQLFRVKLDGTGLTALTPEPGVHRIAMDPAAKLFLDRSSSLTRPPAVTLHSADGKLLRTLATMDDAQVKALGLPTPELLTLRAADGMSVMQGRLFKPADFDSTKRYPLIVSVYGGPHTKAVRNSYETIGFDAAVAQLGFLVAEFDARGTLDRGKAWQAGNYLKMGQVDVDDQAAGVRQLRRRPYVDSTRVGVTGVSHGGFMTIMMMLRYPDVYQVGVADAPLTDPRNGPRQYIGRIMRTPDANPDGYAKADLVARAQDLKGRLLIQHGTGDHNVVFGNTMQFVHRLIETGRPVDLMVYPNGAHVFEGVDRVHGIKTMVSYFLEHLKPEGWEGAREAIWSRGSRK